MKTETSVTETVVRNHLQTFLEQRGIAAILADYDENARLYTEAKLYQGKPEIHGFFTDFIGSLPEGAIDHFALTEPAGRREHRLHHLERRHRHPAGHRHFRGGGRKDRRTVVCHVCRGWRIEVIAIGPSGGASRGGVRTW